MSCSRASADAKESGRYRLFNQAAGLRLALLMLALVSPGAVAQAAAGTPRTIRVVTDNAYAPYSFQSDEGRLQGILIDQWQAWEKNTGIKVEMHAMDWGEALRRMRGGEFDVIESIVETAERRNHFDFTSAYTAIEASIYFRNDIAGITDLASLKGFPVGVKTGDQHIDQLEANGVTTVILFQNNDAIIEAANQHKVNVFVVDNPSALYLLNKAGIADEFRQSAPVFRDELRRAVRKGDAALLRTVSEGFAAIEPGELKRIDERWFGRTLPRYGLYLTYAGYAAAAAILLIAGLIGWNRTLGKRVVQRTAALRRSAAEFQTLSRQKEEHLRLVIDTIPTMAWTVLPSGGVDFVNRRWQEYTGLSLEKALEDPTGTMHPEDIPRATEKWFVNMAAGEPYEDEMRLRRADGEYRWFLVRTVPLRDEQGNIVKWYGTSTDIEDRKRAEDALRESDEKFRQLAENIHEVFWMTTPAMDELLYVSPAYESIWGRSLESLRQWPRSFMEAIHTKDRERVVGILERQREQGFEVEYRVLRPDGSVRWIRDRGFPVKNQSGEVYRIAGVAQDITERKHAGNALRQSAAEHQALSRRLVELQESERRQLSRELHDRVGQNLTALKINLDILHTALASRGNDEIRARVDDSAALLESTMDTIENVMSELRPPMLDDHGLAAALEWHARNFSKRTGIAVAVRANDPAVRPAPHVEIALFRIAQEALNNAAKHARARRVEITLDHANGECVMSVQDDGIGFGGVADNPDKPKPGLGMVTMRERAQAVGGRFEIGALSDRGAQLTVRVPY